LRWWLKSRFCHFFAFDKVPCPLDLYHSAADPPSTHYQLIPLSISSDMSDHDGESSHVKTTAVVQQRRNFIAIKKLRMLGMHIVMLFGFLVLTGRQIRLSSYGVTIGDDHQHWADGSSIIIVDEHSGSSGSTIVQNSTAIVQLENDFWLPSILSSSAKESFTNEQQPQQRNVSPPSSWQSGKQRSIMYVHVGKTGGAVLDVVFLANCLWYLRPEAQQKCYDNFYDRNLTESALSSAITSTTHCERRGRSKTPIQNTTSYLFTVRNPISRAVSAFDMHHVANEGSMRTKKQFYVDCFPTIEDLICSEVKNRISLVKNETIPPSPVADVVAAAAATAAGGGGKHQLTGTEAAPLPTQSCAEIAHAMLTGTAGSEMARMSYHLAMNYRHYTRMTTIVHPGSEIIVARTEHLWNDLKRLDIMLGGDGKSYGENLVYDHGSSTRYRYRSSISTKAMSYWRKYLFTNP
jgi:hypothetical protein